MSYLGRDLINNDNNSLYFITFLNDILKTCSIQNIIVARLFQQRNKDQCLLRKQIKVHTLPMGGIVIKGRI